MIGMRQADQFLRTLTHVLAIEIGDPILGNDVVHVGTGGHHPGALPQERHDTGDTFRRHRRQGDDRLAALGQRSTANEVHLAADARILQLANAVCADLPGKIDFNGAVDGGDLGITTYDVSVIDIRNIQHRNQRVVIEEVVQAPVPHDEAGDDLAGMHALLLPRDNPSLDQIDQSIGKHLRVDAKATMVAESRQRGVRDRTDAHLQGGTVLDQRGNVLPNLLLNGRQWRRLEQRQLFVAFDHCVKNIPMNQRFPVRAGHVLIDLGDHMLGRLYRRTTDIDRYPETAVTVLIGWRHLYQGYIQRQDIASKQRRHLAKEDRHVIGPALRQGCAHIGADKKGIDAKAVGKGQRRVRRFPFRVQVADLDITYLWCPSHHRLDQLPRRSRYTVNEHPVARGDYTHSIIGRNESGHGNLTGMNRTTHNTSMPQDAGYVAPSPQRAPLTDPLYYLHNAQTLFDWVQTLYRDLLAPREVARIADFRALPQASRALLLRLVMRRHDCFREGTLHYPEIGVTIATALQPLVDGGWIDPAPRLSITTLGALLRREELRMVLVATLPDAGLRRSASKTQMLECLQAHFGAAEQTLGGWWPGADDRVLSLCDSDLFTLLRLLFFGNLRQDWSEFVVTELGHQSYEVVPLDHRSRAFQSRAEVDQYLALAALRERLAAGTSLDVLWPELPVAAADNLWLEQRRRRLWYTVGQAAERNGDFERCLQAYRLAWTAAARIRYFRVRERQQPPSQLWHELLAANAAAVSPVEQQSLQRITRRVARKLALPHEPAGASTPVPVTTLSLPFDPQRSVEQQVGAALTGPDSECYYVENLLFNGLLGLLCWPALYAPLPGAFFHPFQAGPADLYREEFVARRQQLLDRCLAPLGSDRHHAPIWQTYRTRYGIACPLIVWPVLTETLLERALSCIPAAHLQTIFSRLLADLAAHRSGLPDLIRFWPAQRRYALIEVKGPGDRLQDHQQLWLQHCRTHGIEASVCRVRWHEKPDVTGP